MVSLYREPRALAARQYLLENEDNNGSQRTTQGYTFTFQRRHTESTDHEQTGLDRIVTMMARTRYNTLPYTSELCSNRAAEL